MSDSATAIVAVAISLVTVKLLDTFRIRGMSGFARTYLAIGSIGLIGFAGSFLSDWAATALGRSSDLTGRTQVWEFFVNYANEKPFVGWGVFSETYRDIILVHARESLWGSIGTAHSAYVQILLEGGYIVLCLFIFYLVYILFTCTYRYLSVKDNNLKLLLSSAIFLIVTMFSESINGFTLGFGLMLFTIAHHDFRPMQTVGQARA